MVLQPNRPGLWHTNSYIVSGIPFVTGTTVSAANFATNNAEVKISFPYITRSVTVINRSATDLRVHFNSLSDGNVEGGHHYITLSEERDSITFEAKCKQIFVSLAASGTDGEFEIFSELTNIQVKEMYAFTGSGLTK